MLWTQILQSGNCLHARTMAPTGREGTLSQVWDAVSSVEFTFSILLSPLQPHSLPLYLILFTANLAVFVFLLPLC